MSRTISAKEISVPPFHVWAANKFCINFYEDTLKDFHFSLHEFLSKLNRDTDSVIRGVRYKGKVYSYLFQFCAEITIVDTMDAHPSALPFFKTFFKLLEDYEPELRDYFKTERILSKTISKVTKHTSDRLGYYVLPETYRGLLNEIAHDTVLTSGVTLAENFPHFAYTPPYELTLAESAFISRVDELSEEFHERLATQTLLKKVLS